MTAILDYNMYTNEMKKGIEDKLFFMNLLSLDSLMDYGCADGNLIETMSEYRHNIKYIGYDFNQKMINLARAKNIPNASFYTDLNDAIDSLEGTSGILCSSLIHEVYSYGSEQDIKDFWSELYSGHYDYVIIRDMALSEKSINDSPLSLLSDVKKIKDNTDKKHLQDFEKIWGSITEKKNLLHYLLKYRYTNNWSREVEENYFPCSVEEHFKKIPETYELIHFEHFVLPFHKEIVKKDFNIDFDEPTHIKMILKKKAKGFIFHK